jgi:hypothetical protein
MSPVWTERAKRKDQDAERVLSAMTRASDYGSAGMAL